MTTTTKDAFDLLLHGSLALAEVEANGIKIDTEYLKKATARVGRRIARLQGKLKADPVWTLWQKRFRAEANLGSLPQLADVLFKGMKLPYRAEFTATGRYRADEETLATVELPFVKRYLGLGKLCKLKSTYLEGIAREVVDGFLHPVNNLNTTRTFRGSVDSPNFQNIPIRDAKIGAVIRRAFVPRDGNVFIEADYGAMEFKIAACVWKDPGMMAYASDPAKDIHRDEAAELFLCGIDQVSKKMRYLAKNQFVFPELYGSYFVKCAKNIWESLPGTTLADGETSVLDWLPAKGIDSPSRYERHVEKVEAAFLQRFPLFAAGKGRQWAGYARKGKYSLLTGFQVQWGKGGPCSYNNLLNDPVQGPAFHCLLWSLMRVQQELHRRKSKCLIVGQIHDCLLLDCPVGEVQEVLNLVERVMTRDIREEWSWIAVPLSMEVDVTPEGGTWYDKQPWIRNGDGTWLPKGKGT